MSSPPPTAISQIEPRPPEEDGTQAGSIKTESAGDRREARAGRRAGSGDDRRLFRLWIWPWSCAAMATAMAYAGAVDAPWAHYLGQYLSWPIYNGVMLLTIALLCVTAFTPFLASRAAGGWRPFAVGFDALICLLLVSQIGKLILRLPRPSGSLSGGISGHTMAAFVCAWLLSHFYPRLSVPFFALGILVGWARIQANDHYAYQVLIGAVLGNLVGYAATQWPDGLLFRRLWKWLRARIVARRARRGEIDQS